MNYRICISHLASAVCSFLLFIVLACTPVTSAQNDVDDIVLDRDFSTYHDASWSADSSRFSFISTTGLQPAESDVLKGVNLSLDAWHQYDLTTDKLVSQSTWPLQPSLTQQQIEAWQPNNFVYTSPDGVLGFLNRVTDSQFLVINLHTNQVAETNQTGYLGDYDPQTFATGWNDTGTVLVAQNSSLGGTGIVFVVGVTNPDDFSKNTLLEFGATPATTGFLVFSQEGDRVYDLAPSGEAVLLTGRFISGLPKEAPVYDAPATLLIWDTVRDQVRPVELDDTHYPFDIAAAAFSAGDETKLLVLHRQLGLIEVDTVSGEIHVIRAALTRVNAAYFSPNSHWLAVFEEARLKFINLLELPLPA